MDMAGVINKIARGWALFVNWFNGILAPLCGGMMMFADVIFQGNPDAFMPISLFDNFPFHDIFFASLFWPGLALLLVNGVPNIIALVLRFSGNRRASYTWGMIAGVLLIVWTGVEMVYIPNALSVAYMIIGVLQLAACYSVRKGEVA